MAENTTPETACEFCELENRRPSKSEMIGAGLAHAYLYERSNLADFASIHREQQLHLETIVHDYLKSKHRDITVSNVRVRSDGTVLVNVRRADQKAELDKQRLVNAIHGQIVLAFPFLERGHFMVAVAFLGEEPRRVFSRPSIVNRAAMKTEMDRLNLRFYGGGLAAGSELEMKDQTKEDRARDLDTIVMLVQLGSLSADSPVIYERFGITNEEVIAQIELENKKATNILNLLGEDGAV